MFRAVCVALALLLADCTPPPKPIPPAVCFSPYHETFNASEYQDPEERAELQRAASDWRAFSAGQVDIHIDFLLPSNDEPAIHRIRSDDPFTLATEARLQPPVTVDGWYTRPNIWLVVNRVQTHRLHALLEHELGHAVGLDHSDDKAAIMALEFSSADTFTPSDLAMCRAACRCP